MRTRHVLRTAAALTVAALGLTLTACNTVSGLGQDLKEASENTSEAIDRAVND